MTAPKALEKDEVDAALRQLPGWARAEEGRIHKEYRFEDFIEAFGFMTRAAIVAEKMDHHPEWANVYNRVSVALYTHDADGITLSDLELAAALEELAG